MKILTEAKDHAFHLNNLAMDYQKDGRDLLADDLRIASQTIKILVKIIEVLNSEEGE
jgi:hypothetical protein